MTEPVRLVPVYDADEQLVAKVNPATTVLHHPVSGRPMMPGTRRHQEALVAMRDYVESAKHVGRKWSLRRKGNG